MVAAEIAEFLDAACAEFDCCRESDVSVRYGHVASAASDMVG
jgi:hypothetical protein